MSESRFDVRGIRFDVLDTTNPSIGNNVWAECHSVGTAALKSTLPRSDAEIASFMGSVAEFEDAHKTPTAKLDDGQIDPVQRLSRPYLAVAYRQGKTNNEEIIGFAFGVDNVSAATERKKTIKELSVVKNWRKLELIAVDPEFQRRGVAQVLGFLTFRQSMLLQPASGYTWPSENPVGAKLLTNWNMPDDGGRKDVQPFGDTGERERATVVQHRHSSRNGRKVARNIARNVGHEAYFKDLWRQFGLMGKIYANTDPVNPDIIGRSPLGFNR